MMKKQNTSIVKWFIVALIALLCLGCGAEPSSPGTPPGSSDGAVTQAPKPSKKPPAIGAKKLAEKIRDFLKGWEKKENSFLTQYEAAFKELLRHVKAFGSLSREIYELNDYKPIFSDGVALNSAGKAMLKALENLESHALSPTRYGMESIGKQLTDLTAKADAYVKAQISPETAKERVFWKVIKKLHGERVTGLAAIEKRLKGTGLNDKDLGIVQAANEQLVAIFEAKASLNGAALALDIAFTGAFFRYVYDMRYAMLVHPFDADPTYWDGVKRQKDALFAHHQGTDFTRLEEALQALVPKIPHYKATQKGLAFYRELAKLKQVKLPRKVERQRAGRQGDLIRQIQERLAQEKYYEGAITGVWDEKLTAAILLYQQTHQLKETGKVDRSTRRSMNRTFAVRAKQVALSLKRYRESQLHQGEHLFATFPVQVRVNIPAFEAEFYKGAELARKHRVVVGNNRPSVHEATGSRGWFNRTRLFTRLMRTVVFNPTWRVPRRIKEQELDLEELKDPMFYERNNYKRVILDNGSEYVIQKPGPKNALGRVKFLFPNPFSIYMHDTPSKRLFKRPIRAFSHGCMRLHKPLELARWLMEDIEGRKEGWVNKVLAGRDKKGDFATYGVALKQRIPVTIEYNTVGVHETGRMMFFLDVYGFDRDLRKGKTPYPKLKGRGLEQAVLLTAKKP